MDAMEALLTRRKTPEQQEERQIDDQPEKDAQPEIIESKEHEKNCGRYELE